ncbi:hypothetical protein [Planococcus sp. YIM B11945]|uniref:hypothetical protein n=1 Tax=Planococcus sp. YIM B11945 TaxID=3435410 RepID=UPI003D7DBD41
MRFWKAGSLAGLLVLGACGMNVADEGAAAAGEKAVQQASEEKAEKETCNREVDAFAFFMADGTTAHFKGEGNEFAELDIRTVYLEGNHVAVYEDNGGTVMLRVYHLGEDRIELVKEEPEFYEEYTPSLEELEALTPISTYLEFPMKKGDVVNNRTIVDLKADVETPYKTFKHAVVFEEKTESGINRSYFVEGFGEVKREFIMETDDGPFTVTSSLESIE